MALRERANANANARVVQAASGVQSQIAQIAQMPALSASNQPPSPPLLYLKVGAGMLGLPHAFAEAGSFVGVLLLLVAGIASSLYVTSRRT